MLDELEQRFNTLEIIMIVLNGASDHLSMAIRQTERKLTAIRATGVETWLKGDFYRFGWGKPSRKWMLLVHLDGQKEPHQMANCPREIKADCWARMPELLDAITANAQFILGELSELSLPVRDEDIGVSDEA